MGTLDSTDSCLRALRLLHTVTVTSKDHYKVVLKLLVNSSKVFEAIVRHVDTYVTAPLAVTMLGRFLGGYDYEECKSEEERGLVFGQREKYLKGFASVVGTLLSQAAEDGLIIKENGVQGSGSHERDIEGVHVGSMAFPVVAMSAESDSPMLKVLSSLSEFLAQEGNRLAFVECFDGMMDSKDGKSGVHVLAKLLLKDASRSIQSLYQAIFCLWRLSFTTNKKISAAFEAAGIPRLLTQVLREFSTEKVVRITLATLRNVIAIDTLLRKEMVGAGLIGTLEQLCMRRWNDEDVRQDLQYLAEALANEIGLMSTWELYRSEVLSGALKWGPAHGDDNFWKENAELVENNKREVLRCLGRLLSESNEPSVVCVACNDLSNVVKFHPRGRSLVQSLGVKSRLMELMAGEDREIRRFALNCVQVMMINKWNLMQRPVA